MTKNRYKQSIIVIIAAVLLLTSIVPTYAIEQKWKWNAANREEVWNVYNFTDWAKLRTLTKCSDIRSSASVTDAVTPAVKAFEPVIRKVLKSKPSGMLMYENEDYVALILAIIHTMNFGAPDNYDPCCVKKYIAPNIQNITPEQSIGLLIDRLSYCERNSNPNYTIFTKNDVLQSVIQGLILTPSYVKSCPKYTKENAQQYINENSEKLKGDPQADFALRVMDFYCPILFGDQYTGSGNGDVASKIVAAARSQIGVPYKYGADRPGEALDCSSLTKYAHAQAGIVIPRTSAQQARTGKEIMGLENALPGDIICYQGHVAIYIGNKRVIHAPTTGQLVKEASVFMGKKQPILTIRRCW